MPGGCWSAAYLAAPVTLSTPSRRVSGWPMFEPWRMWMGVCVSAISGMGESSGARGKGRAGQRRHARGRAGGGKRERTHDDAAGELDLEGVVARRLCVGERGLGRPSKYRCIGAAAAQDLLGLARTPRLGGDAAERDPRLDDHIAPQAQRRGGRGK